MYRLITTKSTVLGLYWLMSAAGAVYGQEPTSENSDPAPLVLDMRAGATAEPAPESALIREYQQTIAATEARAGAYAPDLPEQLLALGTALQALNRHEEAIEVLKRGAHLARIHTGLYTREQLALVRAELRSHLALGDYQQVDNRQRYLYRVEREALAYNEESAFALLRHADWQRQAYLVGVGEEETLPARLLWMWDLYRLSLTEMIDYFGEEAPELREPLLGMIKAQYLIAGHQGFDPSRSRNTNGPVYVTKTNDAFRKGSAVLTALVDLSEANEQPLAQIGADKLALGDWAWWFEKRPEAQLYYDELQTAIAESEDPEAQQWLADTLAQPAPVPMLEGIEALPAPLWDDSGALVISFTVTDTGRVTDIERIREPDVEEDETAISRLLRTLRDTRFRPRFEDGLPATTETIVWSWPPAAWRDERLAMNP